MAGCERGEGGIKPARKIIGQCNQSPLLLGRGEPPEQLQTALGSAGAPCCALSRAVRADVLPRTPPGCSHRLPHSSSHTGLSKPMTFPVLPHPCNSPAHLLLLTQTRGSPPHHAPHCNYQITPARLTWRISGSLSLEETLCLER